MPNLDEIRDYRKKAQDEAVKVNLKGIQDTTKADHTVISQNGDLYVRKDTIEVNLENHIQNLEHLPKKAPTCKSSRSHNWRSNEELPSQLEEDGARQTGVIISDKDSKVPTIDGCRAKKIEVKDFSDQGSAFQANFTFVSPVNHKYGAMGGQGKQNKNFRFGADGERSKAAPLSPTGPNKGIPGDKKIPTGGRRSSDGTQHRRSTSPESNLGENIRRHDS